MSERERERERAKRASEEAAVLGGPQIKLGEPLRKQQRWEGLGPSWLNLRASWEDLGFSWEGLSASKESL